MIRITLIYYASQRRSSLAVPVNHRIAVDLAIAIVT